MLNELERFVARPTGRNYLRVRRCILQDSALRAKPADLATLTDLFTVRSFAEVRSSIERMLPAWSLSPRLYWLGACAALELRNHEDAELDRFLYASCLQGLAATGDGSLQSPYLITYVSDEAELLQQLGREAKRASLIRTPQGMCDRVACEDGSCVYFLLGDLPEQDWRQPAPLGTKRRFAAR